MAPNVCRAIIAAMRVVVVNYGMGNLGSVTNAVEFLGITASVTSGHKEIANADAIILPGVGSFRVAMNNIRQLGIDDAIREAINVREKKLLGICLGFQMLAEFGAEDGGSAGLGYIKGRVSQFDSIPNANSKTLHIGFNQVRHSRDMPLFKGLRPDSHFYFVHSQRLPAESFSDNVATTEYGEKFVSAYSDDKIFGTQFHPEKSQTNGLILIKNFLNIASC